MKDQKEKPEKKKGIFDPSIAECLIRAFGNQIADSDKTSAILNICPRIESAICSPGEEKQPACMLGKAKL